MPPQLKHLRNMVLCFPSGPNLKKKIEIRILREIRGFQKERPRKLRFQSQALIQVNKKSFSCGVTVAVCKLSTEPNPLVVNVMVIE